MSERGWKPVWEAAKCELSDTSPDLGAPLTKLLILANIVAFIAAYKEGNVTLLGARVPLDLVPTPTCAVELSCPLALLAGLFLHASILHLIVNMVFLYIVGDNAEVLLGPVKFLLVYLASGIVGEIAQGAMLLALKPDGSPALMLGASGAIAGLIGVYIVAYRSSKMCSCIGHGLLYYCFTVRAGNLLGVWLILQIPLAFPESGIGVIAHLSGLFTGAALTPLLVSPKRLRRVRLALLSGQYTGLPVRKWELVEAETPPLAIVALLIGGGLLLAVALKAGIALYQLAGEPYLSYAIIEKDTLAGAWSLAGEHARQPWLPGGVTLDPETGKLEVAPWKGRLVVLDSGTFERAPITGVALAAWTVASIVLTALALARPERVDATLLPYEEFKEYLEP